MLTRSLFKWVVFLKILIQEIYSTERKNDQDQIAPSHSPRARGTNKKIAKERVHREESFKSVNLMSAIRALPDWRRGHNSKPCNKNDAPGEQRGTWWKCLPAQECGESHVLLSFWNKATPAHVLKITRGTRIRGCFRSINAHTEQKGFGLRGTENTDTSWVGQRSEKPRLTKQGKKIIWKTDTFVHLLVPGLSNSGTRSSSTPLPQDSSSTSSSPATERSDEPAPGIWLETDPITQNQNKKRDNNQASDDRLRDLPEWLEEFTDNLEDTEMFAAAHTHFSGLRFGTSFESGINIKEDKYLYSLPKRPKLWSMLAKQNYKGSLQKTHWRSSTSCRNVWWLDDSWPQSSQGRMWISKQSLVRCRGTCHGKLQKRWYSRVPGGLHREPRNRRSACTRRNFPWLRSGTSEKSGITEAQYFYSLPKRPELRGLQAKQDYEDSLQKANWEFAEKFGDFDEVLNEGCDSRHNHRYSIVVQDVATQSIQSYPCKTKTSQETWKSLRKFLEPFQKPQVIYTDNLFEFGKSCKE